ncbi:MAG: VOC family protein [Nitrososphaerota archaeon]|nr:VOC family protein [Nitrososphaerota archaeon]
MTNLSQPLIKGLHHVTLITSSELVNRRFYTEILGLKRVKLSVNQDDIFHRHLFYGDEKGSSGSVVTFFEWPHLSEGRAGLSSPHHLAYSVKNLDALQKWASLLKNKGVYVSRPYSIGDRVSIYFRDPDGVLLELTCRVDDEVDLQFLTEIFSEESSINSISSDMRLKYMDHASPIATDATILERFLQKILGLRRISKIENPHDPSSIILGIGVEEDDFLRYIVSPVVRVGSIGVGSIHHIAVKVMDEDEQREIMRILDTIGIIHSGIVDRFWFKSLYFRDPFGNLLEVATDGPGYTVDEPPESLGTRLVLPPWLESERKKIEYNLKLLDSRHKVMWPPNYPPTPEMPERVN